MSGFVVIRREALEHHIIGEAKFFRPWCWLISHACWKPTPFNVQGKTITLQRGQLCVSVRQLADAWNMSKSAVDRFLARLETETMIEREAGHGRLVLTIRNYSKYQDKPKASRDTSGTASGTRAGQQRDTKEQGNKGTIEPNGSDTPPTPRRDEDWPELPEWLPAEPWNGFLEMRADKRKWPNARAVSLMIGKLERWRAHGHDPGAILDTSTEQNWTGLFEPKDNRNGRPAPQSLRDNAGRGERRNRCLDMLYAAEEEIRAAPDTEPDFQDRPALRAVN